MFDLADPSSTQLHIGAGTLFGTQMNDAVAAGRSAEGPQGGFIIQKGFSVEDKRPPPRIPLTFPAFLLHDRLCHHRLYWPNIRTAPSLSGESSAGGGGKEAQSRELI